MGQLSGSPAHPDWSSRRSRRARRLSSCTAGTYSTIAPARLCSPAPGPRRWLPPRGRATSAAHVETTISAPARAEWPCPSGLAELPQARPIGPKIFSIRNAKNLINNDLQFRRIDYYICTLNGRILCHSRVRGRLLRRAKRVACPSRRGWVAASRVGSGTHYHVMRTLTVMAWALSCPAMLPSERR